MSHKISQKLLAGILGLTAVGTSGTAMSISAPAASAGYTGYEYYVNYESGTIDYSEICSTGKAIGSNYDTTYYKGSKQYNTVWNTVKSYYQQLCREVQNYDKRNGTKGMDTMSKALSEAQTKNGTLDIFKRISGSRVSYGANITRPHAREIAVNYDGSVKKLNDWGDLE